MCPVGEKWAAKGRRRGAVTGWTRASGCGRMAWMGSGWSGTAACSSFHEKAGIVKQQFVVLDREEETSSAVLPSAL